MPSVYNGIGTWYWGKTNIRGRRGTCEFCGRTADLKSYDATKYFVVLFLPLIPMGDKRVINECSVCKKHRVISLKEFNRLCDQEIGAAAEEFRNFPNDPARAEAAIGKAIGLEAEEPFLQIAQIAEQTLANNGRVQGRVGAGYAFFGFPDQAQAAYERSLRAGTDPEVQDALAVLYLRQGKPNQAASLIQPIIREGDRSRIGVVLLLAEAYQAAGRHEEALTLLQLAAGAMPGLDADAEFVKYRKVSLSNRESGRRIKSAHLVPVTARASEHRPMAVLLPRVLAPALAAIAFCVYLGAAWFEGRSRGVWIVNGIDRPYDVDISGQRVALGPFDHRKISLPEGDVTVKVLDPAMALPPEVCSITTPFLSRPMLHKTFVINPDHAALLFEETDSYSKNPVHGKRPHQLHVNELLYSFDHIDYEFQEFPSSLTVSDSNTVVTKRRVMMLDKGTPIDRLYVVQQDAGDVAVPQFLRNCAAAYPNDVQVVGTAVATMPPDEAMQFVRARLSIRPVLVEWHRTYQQLAQRIHPDVDLESEYKGMVAKEPDDPSLIYLLARITRDRKAATRLFEESVKGDKPCPYGYFALAYDAMARADYAQALDLDRRAMHLLPDNAQYQETEQSALLALGRYDELLTILRARAEAQPMNGGLVMEQIRVLALAGHEDRARALAAEFETRNPDLEADVLRRWRRSVDESIACAKGDLSAAARAVSDSSDKAQGAFESALLNDQPDAAAQALNGQKLDTSETRMLLYVCAAAAGRNELAEQSRKAAIAMLGKQGPEDRKMADWLAGLPDPAQVLEWNELPERKRIFLTAMGLHDATYRDQYFRAAARFNYGKDVVYWALKQALDRSPEH